jgi:hypothetical protein
MWSEYFSVGLHPNQIWEVKKVDGKYHVSRKDMTLFLSAAHYFKYFNGGGGVIDG